MYFVKSDMQLMVSHTCAAVRLKLVAYFKFAVSSTHCSRFSTNGKRILRKWVVSYHCFIVAAEKFFSSTIHYSKMSIEFMCKLTSKQRRRSKKHSTMD